MAKYKNISNQELAVTSVPGVGVVKPGEVFESSVPVEGANFERVRETKSKKHSDL